MNIELIDKIIEWLDAGAPHEEDEGFGFNMEFFYRRNREGFIAYDYAGSACGTVMCIAGAAVEFGGGRTDSWDYKCEGAKLLGLDFDTAYSLFMAKDHNGWSVFDDLADITPEQASTVLEHLKKTGEVDWSIVTVDD